MARFMLSKALLCVFIAISGWKSVVCELSKDFTRSDAFNDPKKASLLISIVGKERDILNHLSRWFRYSEGFEEALKGLGLISDDETRRKVVHNYQEYVDRYLGSAAVFTDSDSNDEQGALLADICKSMPADKLKGLVMTYLADASKYLKNIDPKTYTSFEPSAMLNTAFEKLKENPDVAPDMQHQIIMGMLSTGINEITTVVKRVVTIAVALLECIQKIDPSPEVIKKTVISMVSEVSKYAEGESKMAILTKELLAFVEGILRKQIADMAKEAAKLEAEKNVKEGEVAGAPEVSSAIFNKVEDHIRRTEALITVYHDAREFFFNHCDSFKD